MTAFVAAMLVCMGETCQVFIDNSTMHKTHAECVAYNEKERDGMFAAMPGVRISIGCVEFSQPQPNGTGV